MDNKRIGCVDVAKGIGIVLVVWAHAKGPFSGYIYQFHMPLFFLISGYLFNAESSLKDYTLRKIKNLYIPFVFWNLSALSIKLVVGLSHISLERFFKMAVKILLTLEKDGQFFGATWFLGALFVESILYKICDELMKRLECRRSLITILFIAAAILGFLLDFPYMLSRTLILGAFFAIGCFVKEYQSRLITFWKWYIAWLFFVMFAVIGYGRHANMGKNDYSSPFLFMLGSCMMSYAILYFSKCIDEEKDFVVNKFKKLLCFLGRRSIDIVIWQFVFFRIVIALQLLLDHNSVTVEEILSYYPVYSTENG